MVLLTIDEVSNGQLNELNSLDPSMKVYMETDLKNTELPLEQVEIWITYGFDVNKENLARMPALKWIQVFQAGVEHIPMAELSNRDVQLTTVKGIHGIPMAEYVMSVVLYYTRDIPRFIRRQQQHHWDRENLVEEAYGKTMAIFGAGAIGRVLAERAKSFGMHVIGINTRGESRPGFDEMATLQEKEAVLKQSDFVVLLLPVTDETYHCMGSREFRQMKSSAYLINIGRGALVDTGAFIQALQENEIKGAALDVFEEDPLPSDHKLWDMAQVLITPHLSAKTTHYLDRCIDKFATNFTRFGKSEPLINEIDVSKGY